MLLEMRYVIRVKRRLGDTLLAFPSALHLHGKGHEVFIDCPREWWPIFSLASYVKACTEDSPKPDAILDARPLNMTVSGSTLRDELYDAFPDLADAPRDRTVLFDRELPPPLCLPSSPYCLVSPFGYSQFGKVDPEQLIERARWMLGGSANIVCLSDRPRTGLSVPVVTARDVSGIPGLIASAEEVFTINSAPNIIAAAVRKSHFLLWDDDIVSGRTNYFVDHQVVLRQDPTSGLRAGPIGNAGSLDSGTIACAQSATAWEEYLSPQLRDWRAQTVLEFHCGSWPGVSMNLWNGLLYYGVDTRPAIVSNLRAKFGSSERVFYATDLISPELPNRVDLIICKGFPWELGGDLPHQLLSAFRQRCRHLLIVAPCSRVKEADPRGNAALISWLESSGPACRGVRMKVIGEAAVFELPGVKA